MNANTNFDDKDEHKYIDTYIQVSPFLSNANDTFFFDCILFSFVSREKIWQVEQKRNEESERNIKQVLWKKFT